MDDSLDLRADIVEVDIRADGQVLWVNADGLCVLRIQYIGQLVVNDAREFVEEPTYGD